jgi:hypothetical protein
MRMLGLAALNFPHHLSHLIRLPLVRLLQPNVQGQNRPTQDPIMWRHERRGRVMSTLHRVFRLKIPLPVRNLCQATVSLGPTQL